ncbi:hybrid sensor histidine kinase/response regulator [Piscinibacter sp. XHJ-5]|uniref:ATP-binding response regulator n=1 Tax=Piscinibacter sp. XHJ-5 TaxID=3037797 RepID=UPI002452E32B|nr:hybrid sensor histidine kinase/response regulator [Piscinibacter sp. XHJ-5]
MSTDAVAEDSERQALARALRLGAALLLVYIAFTLPADWRYLLAPERYDIGNARALDILLSLPSNEKYLRLVVLAACVAGTLVAVAGLGGASFVAPAWPVAGSIALIAVVCGLLSLPAHLPFLLPHTVTLRPDGDVLTQAEYSRAYRDAITWVWSSVLLLGLPLLASGRVDHRIRLAAAACALIAVLAAYLPHEAHKGSRTDNELIIFAVALLTVLYLGFRIQGTLHRETQARRAAEDALQAVQQERTRYEEQTQAAINEFRRIQQRLQAREERRTAFLASAAHDLRQPLAATVLYADLLAQTMKRTPAGADAARHLHVLQAEIASLASAFDAILDYSQMESGKVAARLQPQRLADVFTDLERRFAPMAEERGLSLQFVPPGRDCVVETDRLLLMRLLSNLLSNAVKYTPPRRTGPRRRPGPDVLVRARVRGLLATVFVIDRGAGIPAEMQDRIFEAGVQLDNPQRNRHEGFGLGLATVRSIVARALPSHGVRLKSIVGRGTHLMVDVPLGFVAGLPAESAEAPSTVILRNRLEGALVAVVEDDDSLRAGLVQVLQGVGAYVLEAGSLAEIAAKVDASDRFPDIILTDHRLPHHATGRSVIEAIRHRCGGRDVPAVVLTGDQQSDAGLRGLPGVEVLRKPIERKALLRRLAEHYQSAPSPLDEAAPAQASSSATPARAIS